MSNVRAETDSLGIVNVPANSLWGAQTQRALDLFAMGNDPMPREMIHAYAILKKSCALTNHEAEKLSGKRKDLIIRACEEIMTGEHDSMFPLPVWISGSGTQFNMNINEVIANRCSQLAGHPLGSKTPVHPNDHVNLAQSTNDTFPSAMYMAAATAMVHDLIPATESLYNELAAKAEAWADIIKIGRTHMQDATPLTLGQEFSGYAELLIDNTARLKASLDDVFKLPLGGTAVGTGINAYPGFDARAIGHIAEITGLPFTPAPNKFAAQGSHDGLIHLSGTLKTLAVSLHKIASDIRLLACGPRAGIGELILPANEPGSSIMPGKTNPTQCESLIMIATQAMANDMAVSLGGAGGSLEMNVCKPLIIFNVMNSIRTMAQGMHSFRINLVKGMKPDQKRITDHVTQSLMLATALNPVLGYEKAAAIALNAHEKGLTLRESALESKMISAEEFDRIVLPENMLTTHD
jgi:fumarate hydratase class II